MTIAFYLTPDRKKNLYCRIGDGKERVTFSLEYAVDTNKWDTKNGSLDGEDVHYFTLINLKKHLTKKYHSFTLDGKANILKLLKNEVEALMEGGNGLDGIAKSLFNIENKEHGVPSYDDFLKAFEKHSGLKKQDYKVQALDEVIHFHTEEEVYVMDTYPGLRSRLKDIVSKRSEEDLCVLTESWIWGEIYVDAGIKKHKFLPVMLSEWKYHWSETYRRTKEELGKTDHLDKMKEHSWREMQIFMECYDDSTNIIELASEIDEMEMYSMAVFTMLEIFDADTCYEEYCEYEFEKEDWESISLNDDENDPKSFEGPIFFIKPYEF